MYIVENVSKYDGSSKVYVARQLGEALRWAKQHVHQLSTDARYDITSANGEVFVLTHHVCCDTVADHMGTDRAGHTCVAVVTELPLG